MLQLNYNSVLQKRDKEIFLLPDSKKNGYKVVDLFAGCGGLSLGFENAGFSLTGAFEYWHVAAECHRLNFNCPVFENDLGEVDAVVP